MAIGSKWQRKLTNILEDGQQSIKQYLLVKNSIMDTKEFKKPSPEVLAKNTLDIAPKTRVENNNPAGQHLDKNIGLIEQAEGAVNVIIKLLEQLETTNEQQRTDKHGCIWTLDGWREHNLKHLQKAFE